MKDKKDKKGKPIGIDGGDCDPITVAGGSLQIGSRYGFNAGANQYQVVHVHATRVLRRIEVLYNDPAGSSGGPAYADLAVALVNGKGSVRIDIAYNDSSGNNSDTVTLVTDGVLTHLVVQNTYNGAPLGYTPAGVAIAPGTKTISHRKDWTVDLITVTPSAAGVITPVANEGSTAGPYTVYNGKCQLVLHYFCSAGAGNCP